MNQKPTYEELEKKIAELEYELKSTKKYGLVWDKEDTKEDVALQCENNIPLLIQDKSKKIVLDEGENNILIEGDNYHALTALNFIAKESIDVIYIDPPYNTGHEDFSYNDKYVNADDSYKHSKWLSFIEKRVVLAKKLLNEFGTIFISIDEHEFAQLKLLCDSIFGESNFIENFIWIKNATKNLSKTVSTNHEYVLCYAKKISNIQNMGGFRIKKDGIDEAVSLINECKKKGLTYKETELKLRELYKSNEKFNEISLYKYVDKDFRIYTSDNPSAPIASGTSKNNFDIIHPITQKPCKKTNRGWAFNYNKLQEYLKDDMLIFGKDETKIPRIKRFLDTVKDKIQISYIVDNVDGKKELQKLFNTNSIFENPKPTSLLKKFIKLYDNNAIILDFFAGSGTTGQAVMELNKEDGGHRRFILCTNNENGICENVTYPRLKTVITGIRVDGSKYSDGLPNNLFYFKTDFVKDENNTEQARYCLVEKVDGLLCIAENIYEEVERNDYSSHYKSNNNHLFIFNDYYSKEKFDEFKQRILNSEGKKIVYIYSSDNNIDNTLIVDENVIIKPIPSKIYEIYKEIVEGIKRGE